MRGTIAQGRNSSYCCGATEFVSHCGKHFMPELPEVETVRLGLAPVLVGNSFASVEQRRARLALSAAEAFRGALARAHGRRARPARQISARPARRRRGAGHASRHDRPLQHRSSEWDIARTRRVRDEQKPTPKHEHIVFHLADGTAVRYSDTRRFGLMDLIPGATLPSHALFKGLGIEPLGPDFTAEWLGLRLKGKATSIKAALVDQRLIAGHRQHLCLRGAVSRRHLADAACRHARHQDRQADEERSRRWSRR